ncbi:hypothetical protein [Burkholderia multivorans]|uniref:hypothetical protein n=1 Tax=Burkholderia multivorans TaxID=87883 RepID=UPI00143E2A4D|nr:hypothetical protein [Burkholderia multivorans]QIX18357.1 hypothetical protein FOB32_22810 [Burkholderia multivorans]
MKKRDRVDQPTAANVLQISHFRDSITCPEGTHPTPAELRTRAVRRHVLEHIDSADFPAAAAALVAVDTTGNIRLITSGIEPEMAYCVADELRKLATRIEEFGSQHHQQKRRQRGFGSTAALATIAIAAATYLNDNPLIDVALSLMSHAIGALISRRKSH